MVLKFRGNFHFLSNIIAIIVVLTDAGCSPAYSQLLPESVYMMLRLPHDTRVLLQSVFNCVQEYEGLYPGAIRQNRVRGRAAGQGPFFRL